MLGDYDDENQMTYIKDADIFDWGVDWFTEKHENPKGKIPSPLTYYDNEDGYWDHLIKIKRERRGLPHIYKRTYFKH